MKIISREAWDRCQYTGQWGDGPYYQDMVARGEIPAYYIGRRDMMVNEGRGPCLITEGVHFLIDGDYSNLPVLSKENALVGAAYRFGSTYHIVRRIYRLTEEEAQRTGAMYLDRVETTAGDFALPGSDIYQGVMNT